MVALNADRVCRHGLVCRWLCRHARDEVESAVVEWALNLAGCWIELALIEPCVHVCTDVVDRKVLIAYMSQADRFTGYLD